MEKRLKITGIDFSDETYEQRFEIHHSPFGKILCLKIKDKALDGEGNDIDATIAISANEMKSLGKALIFAAEYVEEFNEG